MKFKVIGIKCIFCNSIIYSRAHHDYRKCSCGNCSIDGGLRIDGHPTHGYQRISGAYTEEIIKYDFASINDLKQAMFNDWNKSLNNYGLILDNK